MRALAVDVVLLPPPGFRDAAIALNRALRGEPDRPIVLDASRCLPHVSLAMGCVREDDIPAVAAIIQTIAAARARVELVPSGFHVRSSQTGSVVTSVELERTHALYALHDAVMRAVEPFFTGEARPEMFVAPDSLAPSTLRWVSEYAAAASFARFWPHVTLGMGALPDGAALPAGGPSSRVALCHLGPHGTCRHVLFDTSLGGD